MLQNIGYGRAWTLAPRPSLLSFSLPALPPVPSSSPLALLRILILLIPTIGFGSCSDSTWNSSEHTTLALTSSSSAPFQQIITQSSFYTTLSNNAPAANTFTIQDHSYPYHPILITILALAKSRQISPFMHKNYFMRYRIPASPWAQACPKDMDLYLKRGHPRSPAFLLLPGTLTSVEFGAFINQSIDILEHTYTNPTIVAMDGVLSSTLLSTMCTHLPWNGQEFALDLYERLKHLIDKTLPPATNFGVIGFSGGGHLALRLMAIDGTHSQQLFGRGAIAVSPVLNSLHTYRHLDTTIKKISHTRTLSAAYLSRSLLFQALRQGFKYPPSHPYIHYLVWKNNPTEFQERLYNAMHQNLRSMATTFHGHTTHHHLSWEKLFIDFALKNDGYQRYTSKERTEIYLQTNSLAHSLPQIRARTLIYHSQDDPILGHLNTRHHTPSLGDMLKTTSHHNPHLYAYTPSYGGHFGLYIDDALPAFIHFVFTEKPAS